MASAVGRNVIAQRVEILAAAFGQTFHCALQSRKNLKEFASGFDGWIDQRFSAQVDAMGFLQEAKWEARDDAESVLTIDSAAWKGNGHGLLSAAALGQIGKIDRRLKKSGRRRILGGHGFDAQREGRQRELFVLQFEGGANRLAGENVFG